MICNSCLGRKTLTGLGNMIKNCIACDGKGFVDDGQETGTPQAPRLASVKRKRRTPAEMAALRNKESEE